MRPNINEKQKVTREEKRLISPILKKHTIGFIATGAGLSRTTVSELKNRWVWSPLTKEKFNAFINNIKYLNINNQ